MDCKFLDSYRAELGGDPLEVWYCRRRDPFVLGQTREAALRACSGCRLRAEALSPNELVREVERRNQELVALNAIVAAVNSSLGLAPVLNTGLDETIEVLGVDAGWIALATGESLDLAAYRGISDEYAAAIASVPADDDVAGFVARRHETLVIDDVHAGLDRLPRARGEGLETMVATPLEAQGRLLGVLLVATRGRRAYSADDVSFVTAAGAQLASAVERALLYRDQLERVAHERRLLEAVKNVNRSLGTHAVAVTVLVEAAQLMGSAKSALLVARGDVLVAEDVYNLSDEFRRLFVLPLDDSHSGRAIARGDTVAVEDVDADELVDPYLVAEGGYRAFLTAPLQSYKGTYGALSVFYEDPRAFGDDEKTILRTFATHAAIALENERLMREKDLAARTDGLTGVSNRTYFEMTLEQTMRAVHRNGGLVSLLFIDVDALKVVNDRRGHVVGDRLLRDLGSLLRESCRETDVVARYGGDEFVVLMPGTDASGAQQVRTKIEAALAAYNEDPGRDPALRVSLGLHTTGYTDPSQLLLEADRRMYEMKRGASGAAAPAAPDDAAGRWA